MARVKLTAGRIADFTLPGGAEQAFLWDKDTKQLAVRATAGAKAYIFQSRINDKSLRITIGSVKDWGIDKAREEARRLQTMIDKGDDPRQVKAEQVAVKEARDATKRQQEARESLVVATAWEDYIAERSAAMKDGKPEWGDRHKAHHAYFVQAGGVKRKRGTRPGESKKTRPGVLMPLMKMRITDLDDKAIAAWLDKATKTAPTTAAQAFRALRAFLTWCGKHKTYGAAVQAGACQADDVKRLVPSPKAKKNDSLRRAQIKPWFDAVRRINNPVVATYLQGLLLTGARRNELAGLRWCDVDFQWKGLTIRDKVKGQRTIPLTPYLEHLIAALPRRNDFVFSSPAAKSGRLEEPRIQHVAALSAAGLPHVSLHGLRRSFDTLAEWVECPAGVAAQIMGHAPSALAEKHYIQRELDLLHVWHVKIESWILREAGIEFVAEQQGLKVVASNSKKAIL